MIFGNDLTWDGTKYSTVKNVAKDCGRHIENYLTARLCATNATRFI